MIPRPCFQALHTVYLLFYYMFAHSDIYFILHLLLIIIYTTCISLSLRRTSAPIHLTSVLGVLGTQETFCIVIAGLLERGSFDLFLPEFDKPWVIHLRETCCCSTNLCTWRPNTVYKNRRVRRHHAHTLRFAELSLGFELVFLLRRKTERLTESLTSATQLVGSGRSRIVGCWWFSSAHLYKPLPGYRRTYPKTNLGLPLTTCAATIVYSIPSAGVHRQTGELVSGTTRLCDPVRERAN
jgi:hypothetical protein